MVEKKGIWKDVSNEYFESGMKHVGRDKRDTSQTRRGGRHGNSDIKGTKG